MITLVERLREALRLDDPLPTQYLRHLENLLRGDVGWLLTTSFRNSLPHSMDKMTN